MTHPFALYNPALLPPEVQLSEYSARLQLLETLVSIVASNQPGHPPQHCLLIGARGMGKTTTLWAVAHKISRDYELARQWQPVVFDEESRRVGDLADFWLEAIRQWEFATMATTDLTGPLLAQNPPDIEERAHRLFTDLVTRSGKRVVLLIDNLNDLLASIRDAEPLHRLRAALMQDSGIMLIGTATSHFEHVTSVDQPFYDFFRIFELKPLTLEEMRDCLQTLAKSHGDADLEKAIVERSGSIQALHILTGGNPRLIKTFYGLLCKDLHTNIREDLERLLDEFTPYYKSVVDALSSQQQRILDAVALAWNPVEVATIATATRLPPNHVSAQIRSLIKLGILREAAGHPKKKTYLLTDRFLNIHYLLRHRRAAKNRLDWFVATIRILFPDSAHELIAKIAHGSTECGPQGLDDARDLLTSAINRCDSDEERHQFLQCVQGHKWPATIIARFSEWFDVERAKADMPEVDVLAFCQQMPAELRKELGYKPDDSRWWYQIASFLEEKQAWHLAESAYRKAIMLDPKHSWTWFNLGNLLVQHLHQFSKAEDAYRRAIELEPCQTSYWNNLGTLLLDHLKRAKDAEIAYRRAIATDPKNGDAWNGLGNALQLLQQPIASEAAYEKAIDLNHRDAYAWNGLAQLLGEHLRQPMKSEDAFRTAIELDPKFAAPWNGLGNLLAEHLHRPTEAEEAYQKAIELDPLDATPWYNLGNLFQHHLRRYEEAEQAYRKAIELDPKDASAWSNLGNLQKNHLKNPAQAEACYRTAIGINYNSAHAWSGLADSLYSQDRLIEARHCAVTGLPLKPDHSFARHIFTRLCSDHAADWQAVLPATIAWSLEHPKAAKVFDFIIDGLVRHAQLTKPSETLQFLAQLPEPHPFESIQDALKACEDREHLHRLAPERQAVALELMKRIQEKPQAAETPKKKPKRTKSA